MWPLFPLSLSLTRPLLRSATLLCVGWSAAAASHAACMGMELQAHRGAAMSLPENSAAAVEAAMQGAWEGAEIDVQSLSDGTLALHHDVQTTRMTSLRGRQVGQLSSTAWSEVRLKNGKGQVTKEPAATLPDVLPAVAQAGKVLNVEIKQAYQNCSAAHEAMRNLQLGLPQGNWGISAIAVGHLQCAREFDSEAYLGVIVLDPRSGAMNNRRTASRAHWVGSAALTPQYLWDLQKQVKAPMGVHVDVFSLKANPNLLADAAQLNMPVFTYSLKGDKFHASELRRHFREQQMLPTGAIIDGQAQAFCKDVAG